MREIVDLREIQKIQIDILRHFDKVCDKYSLNYYLSNGTLLGAVKYKKFIPWDDDIDILMPREDYQKLMSIDEIDTQRYHLMSQEREPDWKVTFSKLCDMRTLKKESSVDFGMDFGLEIDIFPLDAWSEGKSQAVRCGLLRRGLSASLKTNFCTPKTGYQKLILYLIWKVSRFLGSAFFRKQIMKEIEKGKKIRNPEYMGSIAWSLYGKKELIPAHVFEKKISLEFEGELYPAPEGYDRYLRSLYGDYQKDLPENKQITHHFYKVYMR